MNYGEGIAWIIVFKCSIQFVHRVEENFSQSDLARSSQPADTFNPDHSCVASTHPLVSQKSYETSTQYRD